MMCLQVRCSEVFFHFLSMRFHKEARPIYEEMANNYFRCHAKPFTYSEDKNNYI